MYQDQLSYTAHLTYLLTCAAKYLTYLVSYHAQRSHTIHIPNSSHRKMGLDIHPQRLFHGDGDLVSTFLIFGMFAAFLYYEPSGGLITLIFILSTITLFRKEISCNQEFRSEIGGQQGKESHLHHHHHCQQHQDRQNDQWRPTPRKQQPQRDGTTFLGQAIKSLSQSAKLSDDRGLNDLVKSSSKMSPDCIDIANILSADELLISVMSYLDRPSMGALSCTSKAIESRISQSDILWEQIWKMRYGRCWDDLKHVRRRRMVGWSPSENWGPPIQGWKFFMDDFEYGWFDWILAGSNTAECCLIALEGNVYDITKFVPLHPGSPESILMESGGEVTQIFNDIGHSQTARNASKEYFVSSAIAAPRYKNNYKLGRLYNKRQLELRRRAQKALKLGKLFCGTKESNVNNTLDNSWIIVNDGDDGSNNNVSNMEENGGDMTTSSSRDRNLGGLEEEESTPLNDRSGNKVYKRVSGRQETLACGPLHLIADVPGHDEPCSIKHVADVRTFYDPLNREWFVWWPCCGFGRKVEKAAILKELEN